MTAEEHKALLADVDSRYIRQIQEQVPFVATPDDWRVILSFYLDNRANQPHGIDKVAMLIVDCLDKLRDDTIKRYRNTQKEK